VETAKIAAENKATAAGSVWGKFFKSEVSWGVRDFVLIDAILSELV
jgi:hypothetical protein